MDGADKAAEFWGSFVLLDGVKHKGLVATLFPLEPTVPDGALDPRLCH